MTPNSPGVGRLGVGLIWAPEYEPLFTDPAAAPSVVEIEPQTLWSVEGTAEGWHYREDSAALQQISALPQHALLHGVGQPLATATPDPTEHLTLLRHAVEILDPRWVSEHLSFNRAPLTGSSPELGFLLPAQQTAATVRVAAANIDRYRQALGRPVAFETGVNYLTDEPGDLDDGTFFAHVAQAADAGILLDLHNIWCNHVNGRADFDETLAAIDFSRVWEIHLAGGSEYEGMWLDAHSAGIPPDLVDRLPALLPKLTALRALTYEIMPMHAERVGMNTVAAQLDILRALWSDLPAEVVVVPPYPPSPTPAANELDVASVSAWERAFAHALVGNDTGSPLATTLSRTRGMDIYRHLITGTRFSAITRGAERTVTLLLAALGGAETRQILGSFTVGSEAHSFHTVEALNFLEFLIARLSAHPHDRLAQIPHMSEVAVWERAVLRVHLGGSAETVDWQADPTEIMAIIDDGRVPSALPIAPQRVRVQADCLR
jgi:uncharacterized protein (UPF0276 family)